MQVIEEVIDELSRSNMETGEHIVELRAEIASMTEKMKECDDEIASLKETAKEVTESSNCLKAELFCRLEKVRLPNVEDVLSLDTVDEYVSKISSLCMEESLTDGKSAVLKIIQEALAGMEVL